MVNHVWLVILTILVLIDIIKGNILMSAISDLNDAIASVAQLVAQTDVKVDALIAQGANAVPESEVVAATGAVASLNSQVVAVNAKLDAAVHP